MMYVSFLENKMILHATLTLLAYIFIKNEHIHDKINPVNNKSAKAKYISYKLIHYQLEAPMPRVQHQEI